MDLEMMLIQHGWRMLGPVPTVERALALLKEERPDVAVLDINLRGELITPVAEALRTLNVPFVVTSAYRPTDVPEIEVLNGAPFVAKPVIERSLFIALAQLTKQESDKR
jgi:two-component SAPR family response regulator